MRKATGIANTAQGTIEDLRGKADKAMTDVSSAVQHANGLIVAAIPNIVHMTNNTNAIISGIRQGHGAAGKLLTDKTVASNVDTTIANAKQTSTNLDAASGKVNTIVSEVQHKDMAAIHKSLDNTQAITGQLNQAVGTFLAKGNHNESTAEALRDTAHEAQQTTTNLADDTEAIKTNFFLRGFFHRRGFFNLSTLTPSKYNKTRFVKKPRARVWIPAARLFTVGPNGGQEISDTGRSILDQSMSELVPHLPNNPIMVEGYSINGLPDQQYINSRACFINSASA